MSSDRPLVSHVGIAVTDLDAAIKRFALLTGKTSPEIISVEDQKVTVAIFADSSQPLGGRIELVAASSQNSPIARSIEKRGEGLHHVCIHVPDIAAHLKRLKEAGVRLIDETPRIGADGEQIAFVHPSSCHGVLVELQETRK